MEDLIKYDEISLMKDIEEMYIMIKKSFGAPIVLIGALNYYILIICESLNYLNENYKVNLKNKIQYKRDITKTRARMKPYINILTKDLYKSVEELNEKQMKEYYDKTKRITQILFKNLIVNLGIYRYNNEIIGNTFLYQKKYKDIVYKNKKISPEKLKQVGIDIGGMTVQLLYLFGGNIDILKKEIPTINIKIMDSDYNTIKKRTGLFNENIDRNVNLLLLDELSIINFYKNIISKLTEKKNLKYRIGYIVLYNTLNNINTIIKLNDTVIRKGDFSKLITEKEKYNYLLQRDFRNSIFHYDIRKHLKKDEIIENEMFFGTISKYLNTNEDKFKKDIDNYIDNMSTVLEEKILL